MQQAIEQGGDRRGVAQQLSPIVDRAIGRRSEVLPSPHL